MRGEGDPDGETTPPVQGVRRRDLPSPDDQTSGRGRERNQRGKEPALERLPRPRALSRQREHAPPVARDPQHDEGRGQARQPDVQQRDDLAGAERDLVGDRKNPGAENQVRR